MKAAISRFVLVTAIAALVVACGSTVASAQNCTDASPNFSTDFTSGPACLTLNGNSPTFVNTGGAAPNTILRLTPNAGNRVAAVWFNSPQTVQNGFTTTFQFQFTNGSTPPADGIAFVLQNAATGAHAIGFTGGNGGALGYGDNDGSTNPLTGEGIPNSVAVELDTFINGWDSGSANHVAIQSCGTGANTSHHGQACGGNGPANSTLSFIPVASPIFSAGVMHSLTVTYTVACSTCSPAIANSNLDVILDNVDLTPGGVNVDLGSLLSLGDGGTAYVGFTGATGGQNETQDILTWKFTSFSQSQVVTTQEKATFPVGASPDDHYTAQLTQGDPVTLQVTPIQKTPAECDALVQKSFPDAHCFVWKNTSSAVMFAVLCPQSPGGTCGTLDNQNFFAELGNDFDFNLSDNPALQLNPPNDFGAPHGNPLPGWLKGDGGVVGDPCAPNSDGVTPLFQSNQIDTFFVDSVDPAHLKGGSGGTGSCWVATYNTPNEAPIVNPIVAPVDGATYNLNQNDSTTKASYSCSVVNNPANDGGKTGPYATQVSCSGPAASGAQFDTSTPGSHTFTVTVVDSLTDTATRSVTYLVKGPSSTSIVSSTPNPSLVGQAVTVSFAVTGTGTPTGNVTVNASTGETCGSPLTSGAGSCSLTFLTAGPRTLVATYSGDSNFLPGTSAGITQNVNAGPQATVTPSSIDFGTLYLGSLVTKNVTVSSTGTAPLLITGPFLSIVRGGDTSEFVEVNLCPKSLAVGKSCTIVVAFVAGPYYTPQTATLQVKDNAPNSPQLVTLTATVINPRATPNVNSVNFGNQKKMTTSAAQTVTVKNTGGTTLTFGAVSTSGNFAIASNGCTGTLAPSATCQIGVTFTPTAAANYSGTLTINDNAQNSPQKVSLSGKGTN